MLLTLVAISWIYGVHLSHSQVVHCANTQRFPDCSWDITKWATAPSPYICSNPPPYNLSHAAAGSRIRRNVYSLMDDDQALHNLLKAMTCAQNQGGVSLADYKEGTWGYVTTYHGLPGWFDDCKGGDGAQGRLSDSCCNHGNPTFPSWHRLVMVDYEVAVRRFDLTVGLPYWDWIDDPTSHSVGHLPDLIHNQTVWDPILSQYVKNPYFNYVVPSEVTSYAINTNKLHCPSNHSCRDPNSLLFNALVPTFTTSSLHGQILQSYKYENWLSFDSPFENPHGNVHIWLNGNMPSLWLATFDPIFNYHHNEVERLYTIWHKVIAEHVNYSNMTDVFKHLGCYICMLQMEDPIVPFNNPLTNAEPLTLATSANAFQSVPYTQYHYEYDSYDYGALEIQDLKNQFNARFDSNRTFIGWYYHYIDQTYSVSWIATKLSDASQTIAEGTFTVMGPDGKIRKYPRILYRVEITNELTTAGLSLDTLLNISYTVSTGDNSIVLPAIQIHFESSTMTETHKIYWGDNYLYQNASIILDPYQSNVGLTSKLSLIDIDADYSQNSARTAQLIYTADDLATTSSSNPISFSTPNTVDGVSVSTAEFSVATANAADATYLLSCTDCLYPYAGNYIGDSSSGINVYVTYNSVHQFDSHSTFHTSSPQIDFGTLRIPFDTTFIGSELYDTTHYISSIDAIDAVQFKKCPCEKSTSTQACRVATLSEYNQCDTTTALSCNDTQVLPSNGTYYFISSDSSDCANGLKVTLDVGSSVNCDVSSNLYSYNKIGTNQYVNLSIDASTCQMWLNVSAKNDTWFAYGFFGPWDELGAIMLGTASVYKSWTTDVTVYDLCGSGCHKPYSPNQVCVSDSVVNGYRYARCYFTLQNVYYHRWTHPNPAPNVEYTFIYAYFTGTEGNPPFTNEHTNRPFYDNKYQYKFCTTPDDATCINGFDDVVVYNTTEFDESSANEIGFILQFMVVSICAFAIS